MDMDTLGMGTAASPPPKSPPNSPPTTAKSETKELTKTDDKPSVTDEIREKGFAAYVKEIRAKQMEELREKILEAMGLSEDELADMPAEQRNQIEEMIAEEIRRRMMASNTVNSDVPLNEMWNTDNPATKANIQNDMNMGLAIMQAVEQSSVTDKTPSDKEADEETG